MTPSDSSETKRTTRVDFSLSGAELQPDTVIGGRYRVISLLGRGGMGVVYRVNQIFLDKDLALKTIDNARMSPATIRRFQQEARATFAVDHPNIITVNDFGVLDDQTPFLVMEVVDGETLADRLKRSGYLTVDEAIPIFVQVCFGLAYAHDRGIVHRDIKPSNIMLLDGLTLGAEGAVKIVDFGIAKIAQQDDGAIQALTRTGEIFGSPLYMSPEQCSGECVDHRADIYSLGCVLFEALTGSPPCVGENALVTMTKHQTETAPTLREASLGSDFPQALEEIVAAMLAKSPDSRYQNLGQVALDLGALRRGEAIARSFDKRRQETKAQTISMARNKFYALLFGIAVLSAAIVGFSVKQYDHFQRENLKSNAVSNPAREATEIYSRTTARGQDGREYVIFNFPKDQDLGSFIGLDNITRKAAGQVRFEKTDRLDFRPNEAFLRRQTNLDVFRVFEPNDLYSLNLKKCIPQQRFSQIMDQVGRLTGLRQLDLSLNNIGNDALSTIEKLTELNSLSIDVTEIDGAALARLPNLRQLNSLDFAYCKGASDLLRVLRHNRQLEHLDLHSDQLAAADFKAIGTIAELRWLGVNATGMHNSDLVSLTALKKLQTLEAKDCPLTKNAIPVLKIMVQNGLQTLYLSPHGFSLTDIDQIKKLLPEDTNHRTGVYFTNEKENVLGSYARKEIEEAGSQFLRRELAH